MSCACIRVDDDANVPLEGLMRHVAMAIPELPYEVGMEQLRQAYIEFARVTGLLVSHQEILLQRDVTEYPLEAPEGYTIYGIMQHSDEYGYVRYPNAHRWFLYFGERVRMEGNHTLILDTAPSQDGKTFKVALHLLPTECATDIPEEISTAYGRGIAKGAIAETLLLPGKSWSNPRLAATYAREFYVTKQSGRNLHLTNRGARRVMMDRIRVI